MEYKTHVVACPGSVILTHVVFYFPLEAVFVSVCCFFWSLRLVMSLKMLIYVVRRWDYY
jgi:hypothetical protein